MARKNNYPFTPPVQLLYGLGAALDYVRAESLPVIWNRSHQSARHFRAGLKQLGGELFGAANSDSLSPFAFPERDSRNIQEELKSRFGIDISGGQGSLKGKILRISHMGVADAEAMEMVLEALKKLL
jgi:aspartate aminotransferase-like enzyme